jgi:hypothetical protein
MNPVRANAVVCWMSLFAISLLFAAPAAAQMGELTNHRTSVEDVTVDPESFEFEGTCGGPPSEDSLCVTIPEGTVIDAVDIIFVMDVTGSMGDELDEVKTSALSIMNAIIGLGIDAAFGVGSFADYPEAYSYCGYSGTYGDPTSGDYPWSLDQDVTTNTALVSGAINGLALLFGEDWPECYTRALYECQSFSYRANTKKIVLMFGDAPTHDCGFYPYSYGPDPGPNGIAGDADDLDYETVVADLAAAGITVLSIDSSLETPGGDAYENFEYMAVQTGGTHYLLSNAGDIPQAIVDLITGAAETINWLTLRVDPEIPFDNWFSFAPAGYANVTGPVTLCFAIAVTPISTPAGDFNFNIIVDGDGAALATVPVLVHVTGASAVDQTTWSDLKGQFRNR